MTPAELKTTRESLGLPVAWLAERAGVQERTVRYWESGHTPVPADVAQLVQALDEMIDRTVQEGMEQIRRASQAGMHPETVVLVRYRTDDELWAFRSDMKGLPATAHAVLISRLRRALWADGIPSLIQFMDPHAYREWLNGRKDDEPLRAEWAASLPA